MGKRDKRKAAQKKKGVVKNAKNANVKGKRREEEEEDEDVLLDQLLAKYKAIDAQSVAVVKEIVPHLSIRSGFCFFIFLFFFLVL